MFKKVTVFLPAVIVIILVGLGATLYLTNRQEAVMTQPKAATDNTSIPLNGEKITGSVAGISLAAQADLPQVGAFPTDRLEFSYSYDLDHTPDLTQKSIHELWVGITSTGGQRLDLRFTQSPSNADGTLWWLSSVNYGSYPYSRQYYRLASSIQDQNKSRLDKAMISLTPMMQTRTGEWLDVSNLDIPLYDFADNSSANPRLAYTLSIKNIHVRAFADSAPSLRACSMDCSSNAQCQTNFCRIPSGSQVGHCAASEPPVGHACDVPPSPIVCWNYVVGDAQRYYWPNGCKGTPTNGNCTQATVPLTTEEVLRYADWKSQGSHIPEICKTVTPPTQTPTPTPRPTLSISDLNKNGKADPDDYRLFLENYRATQ